MPPAGQRRIDTPVPGPVLPSLLFWLCLFASVAIFAAVYLSPKLVALRTLELEHLEATQKLAQHQQRNAFLARVRDALENDPDFAAEVARFDLEAGMPGEEQLPVPPAGPGTATKRDVSFAPPAGQWWLVPAEIIAGDRRLSDLMLFFAAALAVVAFTFFNPSTPSCLSRRGLNKAGAHLATQKVSRR